MEHLVVHLTREAILGGPVQYRWMYLFERKLGSLKRTIRNKARIEGSIVEAYLVDELSTHCSLYYEASVETRHNREPRNFAPDVGEDSRLGIFKVPGRSLSNKVGKRGTLTDEEMTKIRLYILLNCAEVQPLVQQFEGIILARQPDLNQMQIDIYKENHFVDWFTHTVRYDQAPNCGQLKSLAQRPLRFYRQHEGYFVNGYKFHTITRGQGHVTMNSGVWVKGSLNQNESDYYGELENIYEIKFVGEEYENTVVLFKCRWFDPVTGVKVDKHDLVEVKKKAYGCLHDPYVLASQCFQVFYVPYPSTSRNLKDFCAVVKTKPRAVFEVSQSSQTVGADDDATFFQEHDRVISRPSELTSDFCLADRGIAQEVNVENVNIEDCSGDDEESENESEEEEEFEDDADESSEEELNLSDDSSD